MKATWPVLESFPAIYPTSKEPSCSLKIRFETFGNKSPLSAVITISTIANCTSGLANAASLVISASEKPTVMIISFPSARKF